MLKSRQRSQGDLQSGLFGVHACGAIPTDQSDKASKPAHALSSPLTHIPDGIGKVMPPYRPGGMACCSRSLFCPRGPAGSSPRWPPPCHSAQTEQNSGHLCVPPALAQQSLPRAPAPALRNGPGRKGAPKRRRTSQVRRQRTMQRFLLPTLHTFLGAAQERRATLQTLPKRLRPFFLFFLHLLLFMQIP